jgi:MFS family permease
VATVFRDRPEDVGQHLDGASAEHARGDGGAASAPEDPAFTVGEALRTRAYWICSLSMVVSGLVGTALIFHMSPMLQTAGLEGTAREVALAVQPWPIAFGAGTLAVGWLIDRFRPAPLLAIGALLLGVATLCCLAAARGSVSEAMTLPLMGGGMAMFGASQAAITGVASPTIARYFGRAHHGAIRGTVMAAGVASTGIGPLLAGVGYEAAGQSFTAMLAVFAACAVPLTIGALLLRPPVRP